MHEDLGIRRGQITTIHDPTNTNLMVDAPHKDLRRARSAMQCLAPTTTGSASTIAPIYPELKEKLDGHAVRAPHAALAGQTQGFAIGARAVCEVACHQRARTCTVHAVRRTRLVRRRPSRVPLRRRLEFLCRWAASSRCAIISSVHSDLVLAHAGSETAGEDVGSCHAANALGRFLGTLLSGPLYQAGGLRGALLGSAALLTACWGVTLALPVQSTASTRIGT